MDTIPHQQEPDPIEAAAELVKRLAHSARSMDTESTVVLGSAIIAVAVEVRRLTNTLLDIQEVK